MLTCVDPSVDRLVCLRVRLAKWHPLALCTKVLNMQALRYRKVLSQHLFRKTIGPELMVAVTLVALGPEVAVTCSENKYYRYFTNVKRKSCQA